MKKNDLTLVCAMLFMFQCAYSQVINLDSKIPGRTFEGVGALSAGASSRLLIDYPEPQRSQILDYLFKPYFGASMHHLKVEIGGDVNSTCGTEPSHMHHKGVEDYSRGYEWWLMKEAKTRRPSIMLDALAWGAPYWIGNGTYYSDENADYMAKFVKGAKEVHGLNIDYIGCWNETPYNGPWIISLRQALDKYNLPTRIVAADEVHQWRIFKDMSKDKALYRAVDVLGNHYCMGANGALYNGKTPWQNLGDDYRIVTPEVLASGKPVWSSEDGPWKGDWNGAKGVIKTLVRNYIEARMTKTITWSLVTSYPDILPLPNSGLMMANTPWSGFYELSPALWAMAHVGQFAQPGWIYLEGNANGYTQAGGSYITLMSPDKKEVSIVFETTEARSIQNLLLKIDPLWRDKTFHLWKTDSATHFVKEQTVKAVDGYLELKLLAGAIYSVTTTTGQQKGASHVIPEKKSFPLPYADDFESYPPNRLPRYTIDQAGVFETATVSGRKILRQQIPQIGIEWHYHYNPEPYTLLGDNDMDDYSISIDVQLSKPKHHVDLLGRINRVYQWEVVRPRGYWLRVSSDGTYELCKSVDAVINGQRWKKEDFPEIDRQLQGDTRNFVRIPVEKLSDNDAEKLKDYFKGVTDKKNTEVIFVTNGSYSIHTKVVLASGQCSFSAKKWHKVKLAFNGKRISAFINGKQLCQVEDDTYASGLTGFGCGWHTTDFDNLKIEK